MHVTIHAHDARYQKNPELHHDQNGESMKERIFNLQIGLLLGLAASVLVLFGVIVFWEKIAPLPFRTSQPSAQPASAPADNAELTTRVENLENDQNFNLRALQWKLDQKLLMLGGVAFLISLAAGVIGIKTYNDLDKVVKEKVNTALDKALYQLDPTYLPIHIYKGRVRRNIKKDETPRSAARTGLPDVEQRLTLTGLLNVGMITYLDKVTQNGITVIPIDDEADENEFVKFIKGGKVELDSEEAGFILYSPQGKDPYHIKTAQAAFPNTVIANMPATVASMVLVVGRGLKNREGVPVKKEESK